MFMCRTGSYDMMNLIEQKRCRIVRNDVCGKKLVECMPVRNTLRSLLCRHRSNSKKKCRMQAKDSSGGEGVDIIEGIVGKLFGKAALEDSSPFGMKRLTQDECPEMWPAVVDEFAQPLEDDNEDVSKLRCLLAKTQLEKTPLRLAFDAEVHGWSASAFHDRVNTFGAGLIVAKSAGGAIFGGYNPRGWIGLGEDRDSIASFLFTWSDGDMTKNPVKLPKVGGPSLAVIDKPENGIQFGPDGLKLLQPGQEKIAKSRLGSYYERMPNGGRSLFASGESPRSTELEYLKCYVAQGEGEAWELDGIVWKTKRQF